MATAKPTIEVKNRRAGFEYHLLDTFECGMVLMGTEIELVAKSRWADPLRLRDAGFRWRWAHAADAVADLQGRRGLQGFFRQPAARSVGAKVWLPATTR